MIIASLATLKSKNFYSFLFIHRSKAHLTEKEIWTANCKNLSSVRYFSLFRASQGS